MILQIAPHHLVGSAHADGRRSPGRNGARIDRGEIATGGQDIGAAAGRRAGRTRRDPAAIEGGNQRGALCAGAGAQRGLGAGRGDQRLQHLLRGRAAKHMQPVADTELLDVAKLGIELGDRLALGLALCQAAFQGKARRPGALDDLLLEKAEPAAIESLGRGIFLDQPFHLGHRAMQPGLAERRREMTDHDRRQTAFGLHGLARIVDDEGIDDRHRPQHLFRPAFSRQGQRLAGQPFERAVRTEMDQRVDLLVLAQAAIGFNVVRMRFGGRVMIGAAAIGLEQDYHLAAAQERLLPMQQ